MSVEAAAGDANPRAGGGAPGASRPRANKTQTKHYVKGRHSSGGPRSCPVPAPPGRRTPGWGSRRSPCAPDAAAGPRPGWGRGRGARTPGTKGPHVPTRARARPPSRPAAPRHPSPPGRRRGPRPPPHAPAHAPWPPHAHVLNPRGPPRPPAVARAAACIAARSIPSAGRENDRFLRHKTVIFPRPLPVPLELVKHVFPRHPYGFPGWPAPCVSSPPAGPQLLFSRTARALAQSCDLKRPVLFFFFSRGPARQALPGSEGTRG